MPENLADLTARLLAAATSAGADAADALALSGRSVSIEVLKGRLEHAERAEGVDIGLRVLIGQRQACVASSNTSDETIAEMAARAVAMAREAPVDNSVGLAGPAQFAAARDATGLQLADPAPEPDAACLEQDALAAEAAALEVRGVAQVQGTSASYWSRSLHLATSNGFAGGYDRTGRSASCVAISGEGTTMERDYNGESRIFQADLPDPASIGRLAGDRAVARFGAEKPPTGAFPVLFDERVAASLIGHLLAAINGSAIVRGASWLSDALGQPVLPQGISLRHDPLQRRIAGSKPFDAEGLASKPRDIVADGVLQGWTLDLTTARRLGMDSTANAARGTAGPPSPTSGNVTLTPGRYSREDLIADMGTGLVVTSLIGASVNPNTGDYSRGASGFWVEGGKIIRPVNECTIAGNLRAMLKTIIAANDARSHLSTRVPSLLVEGLTIAGA